MAKRRGSISALFAVIAVLGCAPPATHEYPTRPLSASDLVGSWSAIYDGKVMFDRGAGESTTRRGRETLVLREDGSYRQTYSDGAAARYLGSPSRWRIAIGPAGHQQVVLENARYFPEGVEHAVRGEGGTRTLEVEIESRGGAQASG